MTIERKPLAGRFGRLEVLSFSHMAVTLPASKPPRQRHATKDQLAWRAKRFALAKLGRTL